MTTRGRYLRLHVCIDNRRALAQRLGCETAREFPMTVLAAAVQCAYRPLTPSLREPTLTGLWTIGYYRMEA